MRRLLVYVFVVVLLGSCTKNKTVHFEGIMTSNTNIYHFWLLYNEESTYIRSGNLYSMSMGNTITQTPIPVGEICVDGQKFDAKKGDIISAKLIAKCDSSITITDTIQCDFEMLVRFFVDNVLVEERIISHSSSEIIQPHPPYFVDPDILDKTMEFRVP